MLLNKYKSKVVTVPVLLEQLRLNHPGQSVVLCNGVFDIVHPGHVHHLMYAKSKADVLVVCLTADIHISKGPHRPHVPQEMRALNLAAYEFVNYVVISPDPKPLKIIEQIKPTFYAKGFEYKAEQRDGKPIDEAAVVASYGGEMLFTPGDFIMSSSKLIEVQRPDLRFDKLRLTIGTAGIEFWQLYRALDELEAQKASVHVVGDTIVDSYTYASLIGASGKTPTMSALYQRRDDYVGGAAIVAKHLKAAGADVTFSTVIGDDKFGELVLNDLTGAGIHVHHVVDRSRPTTNKNVFVVGDYRQLKIDTVDNRTISNRVLQELCESIKDGTQDAVVFSDFRHGIFNARTIPTLIGFIPPTCMRVADSQVASRWGNIADFVGFDLITPNEREARFALGDQDSGVRLLASKLYDLAGCEVLLLKLGEYGLLGCVSADHEEQSSYFSLDSFVGRVQDAVGAGDALLAYATLSMLLPDETFRTMGEAIRQRPLLAAIFGSLASAVECEVEGNIPVSIEQVKAKLAQVEKECY